MGETSPGNGGVAKANVYDGAGNPTTFRNQTGIAFDADSQPTGNTYDGDGNPTTYGSASCTFDAQNRMTAYGSAMTAGYDGDGLRTWKSNGSATTYYLYDGTTPVCELNSSGALTANNVFGAHGLLSRTTTPSSPSTTWYAFDAQGSVSQRLSSTGSATSTDKYDAWGARTSTASTIPDPFGYNGQWGYFTDAETGLILCTHRYYDPAAGRWLTRDPIGYAGGVDLYGYCGNRPIDWIDADGTSPSLDCIAAVNGCKELKGWLAVIACAYALNQCFNEICPPSPPPPPSSGATGPTGQPCTGPIHGKVVSACP